MFNIVENTVTSSPQIQSQPQPQQDISAKYKSIIPQSSSFDDLTYNAIDELLEKEKQKNKSEPWNKLDKTVKIQKLHAFAEKYGKEQNLPVKEIKSLKMFFIQCLEKQKLQKTKDVVYDKEKRELISIPALHFNTENHNFTLKNMDAKRVSTLKSLTPKRISEKNKSNEDIIHSNIDA